MKNKIPTVAFVCVHNSCRSQIAEALSKYYASDVFRCYSAGLEIKPKINQDAVRLMKEKYDIDMELTQKSKLRKSNLITYYIFIFYEIFCKYYLMTDLTLLLPSPTFLMIIC